MADTASRTTLLRTRIRRPYPPATGRRHPLVATAMVLPLAALLVVVFGGWDAMVTQASSVGVMLGR
ncbi:hypothetical protein [Streptomyces sp. VRA16 Mangrove soil]|uniref:hypothetical protein n=1 Tax=Streptomyces sp. VRA16 Mangrove soil TaxID=2817434 RepID=UPI001A9FF107|nr:hypothetical protein [Streptomyces sp. VRA16 Mangrove soil]MBO1331673.1 hypothetical protein [Streptomyces sp. VRA16 Mangrove soil]